MHLFFYSLYTVIVQLQVIFFFNPFPSVAPLVAYEQWILVNLQQQLEDVHVLTKTPSQEEFLNFVDQKSQDSLPAEQIHVDVQEMYQGREPARDGVSTVSQVLEPPALTFMVTVDEYSSASTDIHPPDVMTSTMTGPRSVLSFTNSGEDVKQVTLVADVVVFDQAHVSGETHVNYRPIATQMKSEG